MKSQTTTHLVSESQSMLFAEAIEASVNGVDLNLKGFSLEDLSTEFTLTGTEANRNRVKLWLYSAPGDYVREPDKGGPLYALLGKHLNEENAESISDALTLGFNSFFSGDLTLVDCKVIADFDARRWKITLYVNDPVRRELFDIVLGVTAP